MKILEFDLDTPVQTFDDVERICLEFERTGIADECFDMKALPSQRPDLGGLLILDRLHGDTDNDRLLRRFTSDSVIVSLHGTMGRITPRDLAMLTYLRWTVEYDGSCLLFGV